jgi:hypothetical protein
MVSVLLFPWELRKEVLRAQPDAKRETMKIDKGL